MLNSLLDSLPINSHIIDDFICNQQLESLQPVVMISDILSSCMIDTHHVSAYNLQECYQKNSQNIRNSVSFQLSTFEATGAKLQKQIGLCSDFHLSQPIRYASSQVGWQSCSVMQAASLLQGGYLDQEWHLCHLRSSVPITSC